MEISVCEMETEDTDGDMCLRDVDMGLMGDMHLRD
jgi:hypothetical protein